MVGTVKIPAIITITIVVKAVINGHQPFFQKAAENDFISKQYLCQFSPESKEDFNGKLSFKRGLAKVVILKNSVKVFRKVFFNVFLVL